MVAIQAESIIQRLTARTPPEVWKRTLEILEQVNDGPEDEVVVGTARKAICLLDAFSRHGLIRGDKRLLSSRIVDLDPGEIEGRDVLVVEDLVTSTRTLRYTIARLEASGARSVRAIGFARNIDYQLDSGFQLEDQERTLSLNGSQSAALGQTLLDMLGLLSRSYNIDWPILFSTGRPDEFVEAARSVSGWTCIDSSNQLQESLGTQSLTFYPTTLSIVNQYKDSIAIPKVRAIYSPGESLQLIPILAFDKWSDDQSGAVRNAFPELPSGRLAPLAFAQHLMAVDLGRAFISHVETWRPQGTRFRESAHSLQVSYGQQIASLLSRPNLRRPSAILGRWLESQPEESGSSIKHFSRPSSPSLASECEFILSGAFYEYYATSGEKELRDVARRGDAEATRSLLATAGLLEKGLSVKDLESELTSRGYTRYDARAGVSTFLDKAIDTGLVVPILTMDGRRFRPGEVAMFSETAKRLCEVLLRELNKLKAGSMSQFLTQKALVALWKYGTQRSAALLDQAGEGTLVSVQYYTHGAVLDRGTGTSISRAGNFTVTKTLEAVGVLEEVKGGYAVSEEDVYEETDKDNERKAQALARMIHTLTERSSKEWRNDEEFVLWISTADKGQAPTALAADISLCEEEFVSTARVVIQRLRQGLKPTSVFQRMSKSDWIDALTAGWRKVHWIEEGNNERFEAVQRERLAALDGFGMTFLDDLIRSVRGGTPPQMAISLCGQAEEWLLAARILWSFLEHVARDGADQGALDRRARRALATSARMPVSEGGLLDRSLRIVAEYQRTLALPAEACSLLLNDLQSSAIQVVSTIEAATDTDGRVQTFHEYTAAALIFSSGVLDPSVFEQDLRMSRRFGVPSDTLIDCTLEYRQPGVFVVAGRGRSAGQSVASVALNLVKDFAGRYRRVIVFRKILTSQIISQSSRTSQITCAAFRSATATFINKELGTPIEEVGSPFELPESIATSSKGGPRASFHVTASEPVGDGQVRQGYGETATIRPQFDRRERTRDRERESSQVTTDILVVSPMPVERTALLRTFELEPSDVSHIPNRYQLPLFRTTFQSRSGKVHQGVLALASEKGPDGARDLIGRALDVVVPKIIVIHGIAGAIQADLWPGDVIVATSVLPYDYRKERDDGTEVVPSDPLSLSPIGLNLVTALEMDPPAIKRVGGEPGIVRAGTMGSGDTVVRSTSGEVRLYLAGHPSHPEATEMESGAVLRELRSRYSNLLLHTVVVRGISDRADPSKNDKYHSLAAGNAAIVLRAMLDYLTT
jgi:adenosylhomocysteine nucleosidase